MRKTNRACLAAAILGPDLLGMLVDDAYRIRHAAAAFHAFAERSIDLSGCQHGMQIVGEQRVDAFADVVAGENIARTNDHLTGL